VALDSLHNTAEPRTHNNPDFPPGPDCNPYRSSTDGLPLVIETSVDLPEGERNDEQTENGMTVVLRWSSRGFAGLVEVNDASIGALHDVKDHKDKAPLLKDSPSIIIPRLMQNRVSAYLVGIIELARLRLVHLVDSKSETDDHKCA
jgi:hypothetical protein